MTSKYTDEPTGHVYDGISELDNAMPAWWLYMFYASIVFAIIYLFFYHIAGLGLTSHEKYSKQMDPSWAPASVRSSGLSFHSPYYSPSGDVTPQLLAKLDKYIGENVSFSSLIMEAKRRANAEQLVVLNEIFPDISALAAVESTSRGQASLDFSGYEVLTDAESMHAGKEIYRKNCVACHGANGEGGIGPNVTDDYWIHGGSLADILKIISLGVPAKGMIPWRSTLKTDQIHQVASYMTSLVGTDPPNPKAPQGELYSPQ